MKPHQSNPSPNRRSLANHPHYFGIYLNMARHNMLMAINHLSQKYEKATIEDDAQISNASLFSLLDPSKNKPDVLQAVVRDLRRHFPLLQFEFLRTEYSKQAELRKKSDERQPIEAKDLTPGQIRDILTNAAIFLNKLRNAFLHYGSIPDFSKGANLPIEDIYEVAVQRLIDREATTRRFLNFEETHIEHLVGPESEFRPATIEKDRIDEKTLSFFICLFLERKFAFQFLSRLEGFQISANTEPSLSMNATMQAYTMFCCKLPQPKLESCDILLDMLNELGRCPKELYSLLSVEDQKKFKLTAELEDESEISEEESLEGQEAYAPEPILKRHDDRFPWFALRYFDDTNAFPTLRFQVQLGKWLKKPVYLKEIYDVERERVLVKPIRVFAKLKPLLDLYGKIDQTILEEKIVPDEFKNQINPTWLVQRPDGKWMFRSEIEQFSPMYNFGEQTIALQFTNPAKNIFPKLPDFSNQIPDATISTYELRSLFFYTHLHKNNLIAVSPEDFIKDYIERIKKLLRDVKEEVLKPLSAPPDFTKNERPPFHKDKDKRKELGDVYWDKMRNMDQRRKELEEKIQSEYGITATNIPDDIREYLLAYKTPAYQVRAKAKLESSLKDVKARLKDYEKGRTPRVGDQATYLAEDIVFLTPPTEHIVNGEKHSQKLNNDQFRVLQSSLAYFSINREKIDHFIRVELNLTEKNSEKKHPFLFRIDINKCKFILDFYKKYLEAKEKWLNEVIILCSGKKKDWKKKIKAIKPMSEQDFYKKYGYCLPIHYPDKPAHSKSYEKIPVYLPLGLFNKAIAEALDKAGFQRVNQNDKVLVDKEGNTVAGQDYKAHYSKNDNVVYSLERYLDGDTQELYSFPHYYEARLEANGLQKGNRMLELDYMAKLKPLFEKQKEAKKQSGKLGNDAKQKVKDDYEDIKREKARILDREQTIRFVQTNDRALWLMIKDRRLQTDEHTEIDFAALNLKGIKEVLDKLVSVKLKVPNVDIDIVDRLPLKRYGDLRRIAKDRRLENLTRYYKAEGKSEVEHESIKKELEKYDLRRVTFAEVISAFEKTVHDKFADQLDASILAREGYYPHAEFVRVGIANAKDAELSDFFLNKKGDNMRNKFFHNEFPWFEDWLLPLVQIERGVLYADSVFNIAERYYHRLREKIS